MWKQVTTILIYRKSFAVVLCVTLFFFCPLKNQAWSLSGEAEITIDPNQQIKILSPRIFGHNVIAFDPCSYVGRDGCDNKGMYSNWGAGQWNPQTQKPNDKLFHLAQTIDVPFLRFPGGCGVHNYDWKKTIGPLTKRPSFKFGMDEFLTLCSSIGAEPIITMSYFTGSNQDLADMIEYLNGDTRREKKLGRMNWATLRAKNGHPEPYKIKYFELGNEVYHGNHRDIKRVEPDDYGKRYVDCRKLFKQVDPEIELGVVLQGGAFGLSSWDFAVVDAAKSALDFGVIHIYPVEFRSADTAFSETEMFKIALAGSLQTEKNMARLEDQLTDITGGKVPLAITEFNNLLLQNEPIPYRHSLGNALFVTDFLMVLARTDTPIIGANFWQMANSYWGFLTNHSFMKGTGSYQMRPIYYVYRMFADHFTSNLIKTSVLSPTYTSRKLGTVQATDYGKESTISVENKSLQSGRKIAITKWQMAHSSILLDKALRSAGLSLKGNEVSLEFKEDHDINFYHISFKIKNIDYNRRYKLIGKIKTTNLSDSEGFRLAIQDGRGWNKTHWEESTRSITGTTTWQSVAVEFQPLPGTRSLKILIRRKGGNGSFHGKVMVKDVFLADTGPARKFTPTPYISAISSINKEKNTVYLLVLNKNLRESISTKIKLPGFGVRNSVSTWVLNGPDIASINNTLPPKVHIAKKISTIISGKGYFRITLEPHSLTAFELKR